ncbi:hypothetical protein ACOSOMT5_P0696 [Acidiphilium sp. MT5]
MVRGVPVSIAGAFCWQPRFNPTRAPAILQKNFFLHGLGNNIAEKCWKDYCVLLGFWAVLAGFLRQCGDGERHAIGGPLVCGTAR